MENSPKEIEKLTQKWVQEAGLEQPSLDFVQKVMEAVDVSASKAKVYRPLISKRGWSLVAALFIVCVLAIYLLPLGDAGYLTSIDLTNLPSIQIPFEGMTVSKPMLYAVGFLALFLVQIPFLKRKFIN